MTRLQTFTEHLRRDGNYRLLVILLFVLHAALISPSFFPSLNDIGVWDEATYVNEGRELVGGKLTLFSGNPAVAAVYALTYLPVHASPQWLVYSCSLGRFIFFSLLWLATFFVAGEVATLASPFIVFGLLLISPVAVYLLSNGSDALFAAMSGFALWQFLAFQRTRRLSHLWLCSSFLGLAALSRNEGPLVFLIVLGLSVLICAFNRTIIKALVACIIPFTAIVAGYVLLYGLCTGRFETGTANRSYLAFEQGHAAAIAKSAGAAPNAVDGQLDARQLFGTPEENHHSVLQAIRRNPHAYLRRVVPLTKQAAQDVFAAYGWYLGVFVMLFAARGVIDLLRRKSFLLLATLALWPAYCVLYVLLNAQRSHWVMPFLSVFGLAAVGISAFSQNLASRRERYLWSALFLILLIVFSFRMTFPNGPLAVACGILAGLWIIWLVADRFGGDSRVPVAACLILFSLGTIVGPGIPHSEARVLGTQPDERAVAYLRQNFAQDSRIATWGPGKVWNAKMEPITMALGLDQIKTSDDLFQWMTREQVQAIFVDDYLRKYEPGLFDIIQKQVGSGLTVAFDSGQGAVQVLVPSPRP